MGTTRLLEDFNTKHFPKTLLSLTATATQKKRRYHHELGLQDVHVLRNHLQEKTSPTWFLK
jgi:hypothetical protein